MHHTGTTLAGIAADMRAGQAHCFADEADEKRVIRHICTDSFPVQAETYGRHWFLLIWVSLD
jgi:hypothetical protein